MNNRKGLLLGIVIGVIIVFAALFFFKGTIYTSVVKYEDAGNRKSYEIKDQNLILFINQNLPNDESLDENIDIETIADLSLEITSKRLDYFSDAKENDPQKITDNLANYQGFAAHTAAVGNYLLRRFELHKEWEVKPKKGKLYLFGSNMTKGAKDGWFKDHDIVVFLNKNTKEEVYVDPGAYESFGVRRVERYKK